MYLDIGNNRLISDKFFDDFSKNDLEYTKNVEFINEDDNIAIRSIIITNRGVYKSNISGTYLMNNFMKGI